MPGKVSFNEKCAAFLLGLGTRLQVQLIGFLPFSEAFVLLAFPFFLPRIQSSGSMRRTAWCVPLLFVWLGSLIASDLFRQTDWSLAARGVARIIIYMVAIPFCTWFLRSHCYEKVLWWTIGTLPSFVLSGYVFRGGVHEGRELVYGSAEISYETHWGGVVGIAVVIFCLLMYQRRRFVSYSASLGLGAIHIVNGIRSAGALAFLAVAITSSLNGIRGRRSSTSRPSRVSFWKLVIVGIAGIASLYGISEWYGRSARTGSLGERARVKYESQVRNRFGLVAGGRPEFVGALLAISESPLIGYGSWPLDHARVFARACDIMEVKVAPSYYKRGYPLIPSHSHVLGAWVEAGLLGSFFFLYIFVIAGRSIYLPILDEKRLRFWLISSALMLLWAILFNPISGRLETSFLLGAIFNQVVFRQAKTWNATAAA